MCQNHFLNFCTLPLICYNILKMASIEVKLITSSSQTCTQVVVSGTDFPANFCLRICMSRIPCLRHSWRIFIAWCRRAQARVDISFRVRIGMLAVVHTPELSSCRRSPTRKQIFRKQAGALNYVLQMQLIFWVTCFKIFPSAKEYLTLYF